MSSNFINSEISRTNRNLLLVNVLTLSIICWMFYANSNYLYNFYYGPFTVDESFLNRQDDTLEKFVTVSGSKVLPTGLQHITQTKDKSGRITNEQTTGSYVALFIGSHFLVTLAPLSAESNLTFTGEIQSERFQSWPERPFLPLVINPKGL